MRFFLVWRKTAHLDHPITRAGSVLPLRNWERAACSSHHLFRAPAGEQMSRLLVLLHLVQIDLTIWSLLALITHAASCG